MTVSNFSPSGFTDNGNDIEKKMENYMETGII